ncbi:MAG: UdgX family uracil-DNA binding protein [Acidobacteriota bacterium]
MTNFVIAHDYASWREQARALLHAGIPPHEVIWNSATEQASLFTPSVLAPVSAQPTQTVPPEFLELAEVVCHHRDVERFALLYQMLWRLTHGEKHLLRIASDPLTRGIELMQQAVRRDVHKTKAFVRFRKTADAEGREHYVAWHRPDHYSLRLSAPFFQRRFAVMRWTILTPDESAHWDGEQLHYGPGATAADAPDDDQMEVLWKEFYRAIFNPARIKLKAMKKEMPVRHWPTLPEAAMIDALLREAPRRVEKMIAQQEGMACAATDFLPAARTLETLRAAAQGCQGCELYRAATQTVFGVGPRDAAIVLVGEQPGDEEDLAGEPFIGPAGEVLNRALAEAGLKRSELYLTNAVKHFKHSITNGRRIHRTPTLREINACKPWLEAELSCLEPKVIVCLGVSAARSLISPSFALREMRGELLQHDRFHLLATYHPSAVLRGQPSDDIYAALVADLRQAAVCAA